MADTKIVDIYINDATTIWKDFKKRMKDKSFKKLNINEQLDFYQKKHRRFAMMFPIVLRYMIQLRQYNKKAFSRFIKKLHKNPYKSKLEFCERQADYVKYLHMELSRSHNTKEAQKVWQSTYDMLAKEVEMFDEMEKKVKNKMEKNNNRNIIEKRNELKELLGSSDV